MQSLTIHLSELSVTPEIFQLKALAWGNGFPLACYYNPHNIAYPHQGFKHMLAVSGGKPIEFNYNNPFENLQEILQQPTMYCGYLGYDLKNNIEELCSENYDGLGFPPIFFFNPDIILNFSDDIVIIEYSDNYSSNNLIKDILNTETPTQTTPEELIIKQRVSKSDYVRNVEKVRSHILEGDVYELNYCIEFYAEDAVVSPLPLYLALSAISPTPFSGYLRYHDKYLLCASPERFLKKAGKNIISQPIKGTIKRGNTPDEDEQLRLQLRHDEKELAENMMIVDLVRNDLSKTCKVGSVHVEEMFGTYGFKQVWQLISTITGTIKPDKSIADVIKGAFPMGSMTGAPKISAMQLIEKLEDTRRGLYSGAFGYITPLQDCDFNVVIRSIQYNATNNYLSFMVGSAITYDSDPEREYDECMLKAKAMLKVLGNR
jgi:para-aminobenzoate synthetase component I